MELPPWIGQKQSKKNHAYYQYLANQTRQTNWFTNTARTTGLQYSTKSSTSASKKSGIKQAWYCTRLIRKLPSTTSITWGCQGRFQPLHPHRRQGTPQRFPAVGLFRDRPYPQGSPFPFQPERLEAVLPSLRQVLEAHRNRILPACRPVHIFIEH